MDVCDVVCSRNFFFDGLLLFCFLSSFVADVVLQEVVGHASSRSAILQASLVTLCTFIRCWFRLVTAGFFWQVLSGQWNFLPFYMYCIWHFTETKYRQGTRTDNMSMYIYIFIYLFIY